MAIDILAVGDKVRLYSSDGNKDCIVGSILNFEQDDVEVLLKDDLKKIASEQAEVIILEIIKKDRKESLYIAEAAIVKFIADRNPTCRLKVISDYKRLQRRNYVRVSVTVDVDYLTTDQADYIKGLFLDISGGGALLNTAHSISIGSELVLRFNIPVRNEITPFEVKGRIVRTDQSSRLWADPNMSYQYGLRFEDLTTAEQDGIISYVMQTMRERYRNIF